VAATLVLARPAAAQYAPMSTAQLPGYLARDQAVRYALENNPQLMTARQQHGFAEAAVVMARTYPFNPIYGGVVAHNSGPDVTNPIFEEHYATLELELRGQGRFRREAACATASRIEWEITQQEMIVAIAVIRAYNTGLYRQKKLEALEATIKLNEQAVDTVSRLVDAGKLRSADLLLARAELENVRAQRGQLKTSLAMARSDLRRLLGTLDDTFTLFGALDLPLPNTDQASLTQLALTKRADLQARQIAIHEAEANLKLVQANRFGNPSIGPFFEYDNTRVVILGAKLAMPLPCLNTRRGEIMKAEAELVKVHSEVKELEMRAAEDVQAALNRLGDARKWAATYEKEVVPSLQKAKQEMEKLFANNDPGADVSRVLAVQRTYLKATETLVDATFEISQAEADLALAVAEPALAVGPAQAPPPANLPTIIQTNFPVPTSRAVLGKPLAVPDVR